MYLTGKKLLVVGLILAVLSALIAPVYPWKPPTSFLAQLFPWLVGGTGILTGLLNFHRAEKGLTLLKLVGLVVALTAILLQPFNPAWLNNIVFFARVFFAHALLAMGALSIFILVKE